MRVALFATPDASFCREIVRLALAEDVRWGDVTTDLVVPDELRATGTLVVRTLCVLAGLVVATECFRQLDPHVEVDGGTATGRAVSLATS